LCILCRYVLYEDISHRHCVLDAIERRLGTQKQVAKTFGVSAVWIRKLLHRKRQTGSIEPLPCTQGSKPAFRGTHLAELNNFVKQHSDTSLEEIKGHFSGKVDCSLVAIHQTLKRLGWRYKKKRYEQVNVAEKT
jgi:transposase